MVGVSDQSVRLTEVRRNSYVQVFYTYDTCPTVLLLATVKALITVKLKLQSKLQLQSKHHHKATGGLEYSNTQRQEGSTSSSNKLNIIGRHALCGVITEPAKQGLLKIH